jgi:hypothetical protein
VAGPAVRVLEAGLFLLRRATPVRTHGPIEFPLTVLTEDASPPAVGHRELAEYFGRRELR